MEKKKKSIVIGMTSLLLATLILLGLTYAYYKTRIVGNSNEKSVSVTSKNLSVTYQNESAEISAEGIEPGYSATKTFEVKNTGSESVEYSVMLDNVTNTFTRIDDWTYTISENGTELKSGTLPNTDSYILYSESIDAGATKSYTLKIDYADLEDVDQSEDMGKSLTFRINIDNATASTLTSADEGTLLYAIGRDNVISEPLSVPGQQASLENEAVLASTEDDDGTSYYFRGNVINNYVTYSNMCWRVVRVQRDGTIKLALADENHPCGTVNGYDITNGTSALLTSYSDCYGFYEGNSKSEYSNSVFMQSLKAWAGINEDRSYYCYKGSVYEGTFSNEVLNTTNIVNTDWCIDTAITEQIFYKYSEDEDLGYTYNHFGSWSRNHSAENATPTLKCNTKGMEGISGKYAQATKYIEKIGMLTADEVAFAGSISSQSEDRLNYYLKTNASGNDYWTSSPSYIQIDDWATDNDIRYIVSSGSGLNFFYYISYADIRPSIVLASTVTITSTTQDGTVDNPYIIN